VRHHIARLPIETQGCRPGPVGCGHERRTAVHAGLLRLNEATKLPAARLA
jgi:hypothetical protein